jgi:NADH:ubiquinone oxidoreductase subunit C
MEGEDMSFPGWMKGLGKVCKEQGHAIFTEIPLSGLEKTMKEIRSHDILAVNGISGYDSGKDIQILYHFVHAGLVLSVKTRVSREKSEIPSVTGIFPNAMLYEQENHEMLGLKFIGNKSLEPVLLAGDSPRFPLRKKGGGNAKG